MKCNFSGDVQRDTEIDDSSSRDTTKRFILRHWLDDNDGEIEEDVERRIRLESLKWRLAFRVLHEQCIQTRLKRKKFKR